jgi:hypothetical protein
VTWAPTSSLTPEVPSSLTRKLSHGPSSKPDLGNSLSTANLDRHSHPPLANAHLLAHLLVRLCGRCSSVQETHSQRVAPRWKHEKWEQGALLKREKALC